MQAPGFTHEHLQESTRRSGPLSPLIPCGPLSPPSSSRAHVCPESNVNFKPYFQYQGLGWI